VLTGKLSEKEQLQLKHFKMFAAELGTSFLSQNIRGRILTATVIAKHFNRWDYN